MDKPPLPKSKGRLDEADGGRMRIHETVHEDPRGNHYTAELRDYDRPEQRALVDGWNLEEFSRAMDVATVAFAATIRLRQRAK